VVGVAGAGAGWSWGGWSLLGAAARAFAHAAKDRGCAGPIAVYVGAGFGSQG
jgi:hypothetical protein